MKLNSYILKEYKFIPKKVIDRLLNKNPISIKFLEHNTKEQQRKALDRNLASIFVMKNADEDIQLYALKKNINIYPYINNPTRKVTRYYNIKKCLI